MVHAIQSEWIFIQRVTLEMGGRFAGVDKMIRETFLHRLFFGKKTFLSPIVGYLTLMPINKFGLGLLNLVTSAKESYLSSQQGKAELFWAIAGGVAFSNVNHLLALWYERPDGPKTGMT